MNFPPSVKRGASTHGRELIGPKMRRITEDVHQKFLDFVRSLTELRDATTSIPLQNEIHQKFVPTSNRRIISLQSPPNDPPNQLWNEEEAEQMSQYH
jgi:hypothetical protein